MSTRFSPADVACAVRTRSNKRAPISASWRSLTLADLRPCSFNLLHRPDSWFDTFAQWEEGPPQNLAEWQAAIAEIDAR